MKFMTFNCAKNPAICRRKNLKYFPMVEIYIARKDEGSFEEKMRERLLV